MFNTINFSGSSYYKGQSPIRYTSPSQYNSVKPEVQADSTGFSGSSKKPESSAKLAKDESEDWTKIKNLKERRKVQNKLAQREYRKRLKKRLEDAEMHKTSQKPLLSQTASEIDDDIDVQDKFNEEDEAQLNSPTSSLDLDSESNPFTMGFNSHSNDFLESIFPLDTDYSFASTPFQAAPPQTTLGAIHHQSILNYYNDHVSQPDPLDPAASHQDHKDLLHALIDDGGDRRPKFRASWE